MPTERIRIQGQPKNIRMAKMRISFIAIVILVGTTIGCSGKLYTVINPDLDAGNPAESKVEGILFYPSINVMEVYKTTLLADKATGNIIGKAPDQCTEGQMTKFTTRTNFDEPRRLVYEAGLLETNKFSATLEQGTLKSVNTESDPSKAITAVAGALTGLLPFAVGVPSPAMVMPALPLCNAGLKLVGIYEAPPVQPYSEAPNIVIGQ